MCMRYVCTYLILCSLCSRCIDIHSLAGHDQHFIVAFQPQNCIGAQCERYMLAINFQDAHLFELLSISIDSNYIQTTALTPKRYRMFAIEEILHQKAKIHQRFNMPYWMESDYICIVRSYHSIFSARIIWVKCLVKIEKKIKNKMQPVSHTWCVHTQTAQQKHN